MYKLLNQWLFEVKHLSANSTIMVNKSLKYENQISLIYLPKVKHFDKDWN